MTEECKTRLIGGFQSIAEVEILESVAASAQPIGTTLCGLLRDGHPITLLGLGRLCPDHGACVIKDFPDRS